MPIIRPRTPKLSDYRAASIIVPTRGAFNPSRFRLVYTLSDKGVHYTYLRSCKQLRDESLIVGLHYERHRGRIERKRTPGVSVKRVNGKYDGEPYRRTVAPHWVVTKYEFPAHLVKSFQQHTRHFDVELDLSSVGS